LGAAKHERADAFALAQQWHADDAAMAHASGKFLAIGKLVMFRLQIVHMHRLLVEESAPSRPATVDRPFFQCHRNWSVMRAEMQMVAGVSSEQGHGVIGLA